MSAAKPSEEMPSQPVPWTAVDILIALFLVYGFWTSTAFLFLDSSGFFRWRYGPEMVAAAREPSPKEREQRRTVLGLSAGTGAAEVVWDREPAVRQRAASRLTLWVNLFAYPFQILTIPFLFFNLRGVPPAQLGLTGRAWGRNVLAGLLAGTILTPLLLGLNVLVVYLYQRSGASATEEHPFTRLAAQGLGIDEWVAVVISALVGAPVLEELIFRGMLQRWFGKHSWGGHVGMSLAFVMTLLLRRERLLAGWQSGGGALVEECMPLLFIVALVPVYLLVCRRSRTMGRALFAASLLFACGHASVWPTPIALLVLALGLGWLAQRTQSLVGPIVLHALFNSVSCVLLLWP